MSGSDERSVKVVGLVLPRDGDERVLLARHTYGPPVWAMIGGMAKPGEAPDAAARREALQETGQTVSTDRLLAVCDRDELMLFVFEGHALGGQLSAQAEEIAELRWFAPNELTTVPIYPVMTRLTAATAQPSTAGLVRIDQAWPDGPTTPVYICPEQIPRVLACGEEGSAGPSARARQHSNNDLLTAWVIVAGLRFIHGRLAHPL